LYKDINKKEFFILFFLLFLMFYFGYSSNQIIIINFINIKTFFFNLYNIKFEFYNEYHFFFDNLFTNNNIFIEYENLIKILLLIPALIIFYNLGINQSNKKLNNKNVYSKNEEPSGP
jgi:hypothetical protein